MDDEFLRELSEPVRPEFAQALYAHLQAIPERRARRWLGPATAIVLVVMSIIACATPQIRIPILKAIETPLARVVGEPAMVIFRTSLNTEQRVPLEVKYMDIEQVREEIAFPLRLPAWLPAGLEPTQIALITPPQGKIGLLSMEWTTGDATPLRLDVWWPAGGIRMQVEETVEINGQPASFVREPGASGLISLTWVQQEEGAAYILTANPEYISKDALLQIAATMR
ncbi:MAG TPA: hypothetical protein PKZ84_16250 [Anaerolineae bacterium]|nr:hypothetical protein [Anaerolineae bacterium]HQI86160.1 hypothetical protein [Anaerolineae bacterium]